MSFLDSLLSSIDQSEKEKTEGLSEVELLRRKQQKEQVAKENKRLQETKARFELHLHKFITKSDEEEKKLKELGRVSSPELRFPPMEPELRHLLHDVADSLNLVSHSFGEGNERYCIVYRKPGPPADMLYVLKKNDGVLPKETLQEELEEARSIQAAKIAAAHIVRTPQKLAYKSSKADEHVYKADESSLIKLNVNKRDLRTIEEVQIEIEMKRKKRMMAPTPANSMEGIPIPFNPSSKTSSTSSLSLSSSSSSVEMTEPSTPESQTTEHEPISRVKTEPSFK